MNITNSRPLVGAAARVGPAASATVSGPSLPEEQLARTGTLKTIETTRRAIAAQRGAGLEKLESQVRGNAYAPDAALIAAELVADAGVRAGLKSMLAH